MDKWESMYRIMAQAVEQAIELLIDAENEAEEIYLAAQDDEALHSADAAEDKPDCSI